MCSRQMQLAKCGSIGTIYIVNDCDCLFHVKIQLYIHVYVSFIIKYRPLGPCRLKFHCDFPFPTSNFNSAAIFNSQY